MRQDLTTGPVTRTMLLFALPMILGNILQQCYNLADTWIVGRFISTDALGAVGSAYTLMTFLTSLILGMCMGAGALFSISYGGKDLRQGLRVRGRAAAEIFAYASTTGAQQSVMNFGILMVQGLANSFGTAVMAAFAAGVKIDTLAYMPAQEFGNAYSIFISQNYGAGRGERIRAGTKSAVALVLGFCALVSALVWVLAPQLMGIFIPPHQAQSLAVGVGYLRIEGACYVGIGVLFLLYGYFRAVAQPRISLLLTVISLGTRVLLAYSCAPWFGVEAIWWAIPIGWVLADLVGGGLVQRVQILRPLSGGTTGV